MVGRLGMALTVFVNKFVEWFHRKISKAHLKAIKNCFIVLPYAIFGGTIYTIRAKIRTGMHSLSKQHC